MQRPLDLLIVEDNPSDAELVVRALHRHGFDPTWQRVETEADFLAALRPRLDIILSDYTLPEFSAPAALDALRSSGLEIPFIIVSGTIGEDTAVAAMKQGAADYLLKDRLTRLGPAIEHAIDKMRLRLERKQTEARVHELVSMLDHTSEAIIVRDIATRRISYWNQGAERLYGWTAGEAINRDIAELIFLDPQDFDAVNETLLRTGVWHGEYRHIAKAGKRLIISAHISLVRDDHGTPTSVLGINIDITERKSLEAQFLRAQRMESIGTLAAGVAHDLNNILAPIMMSVPMLRGELSLDSRNNILSVVETAAKRGTDIVRQVLTFARGIESQRLLVQPVHLIKEMAGIARETFPKSITIRERYSEDAWPVEGDPTQLHQVLLNLCVNARDAMPNGGELVIAAANLTIDEQYARMMPDSRPGSYSVISVSDTGTGIHSDILEKIFDPFFTTKEPGSGTGLGLSTVIGIAKKHGGFVTVESELRRGTTFKVHLPSAGIESAASPATEAISLPPGHDELLLVVDDEDCILRVVTAMLTNHGYRVLTATDGTGALANFAQGMHAIKAVITDITMPFMDGLALIRTVRKMSPRTPVIVSSGAQSNPAREAELMEIGVNAVLAKPYTARKLLTTLREILDASEGAEI